MTAEKSTKLKYKRIKIRKENTVNVLTEAQKLAFAPFTFQVLSTMIDFNILQTIAKNTMTIEEIQKKCNLSCYTVKTLLEAAEKAGLVKKDETKKYSSTKLSEAFLYDDMTAANFNFMKDVCYLGASELTASFKEKRPAGLQKFFFDRETIYPVLTKLPPQVKKSWYEFDHHYSDDCFDDVLKIIFSQNPKNITDIGGNTGKFEKACLEFDKDCKITMVDLPENIQETKKTFNTDRLNFHAMNILEKNEKLPPVSGAVLMSQFLDCFSEEQILTILNKVCESITDPQKTRVYILEPFIDNQKFEGAALALSHISLYFTCMANGNSKMYNEEDMLKLIEKSGLKLSKAHYNIGKYDYTLLECVKK